jgi:4-amino-4-deoxychorismate lyase
VNSVFLETIKSLDGEIFNLSYHQKRYESVLGSLGATRFADLRMFLNPPKNGLYRCRVVYSLENIEATYHPYVKRDVKTLKLIYDDEIEYSKKYENRSELNALFARKEEADDILIIKNSLVTDTSAANVAFFDETRWETPKNPLLKGVTRARLLEEGEIYERDIRVDDLKNYTKAALLNAMIDFDIIPQYNARDIYC